MVFEIVEHSGPKCLLRVVDTKFNRCSLAIIRRDIHPDCKIHYDGLGTYSNLNDERYAHSASEVNHSIEFVTQGGMYMKTVDGDEGVGNVKTNMHGLPSEKSLETLP